MTNKTSYKYLLATILSALALPVCAQNSVPVAKHAKKNISKKPSSDFYIESGPPPGFKAVALAEQNKTTIINVYYGDLLITNDKATFNNSHIQLNNPRRIAAKLPYIKNNSARKLIAIALGKKLENNAAHLCSEASDDKPYCSAISPDVAGVIFDRSHYRAYIFVNPKYLALQNIHSIHKLGKSSAGFSISSQNQLLASKTDYNTSFSLYNKTLTAYRNMRTTIALHLEHDKFIGGVTSNTLNLDQLSAGRFSNDVLYQGGLLTTNGGIGFISSQGIAGVLITNDNPDVANNDESSQGSPLHVFLTSPSTIKVYKNGNLLYSQHFEAGKQALNTESFPSGSYNITLEIISDFGTVTKQSQFYVKQSQLPPLGRRKYHFAAGFLQNSVYLQNPNSFFYMPHYNAKIPVVYYNELRAFSYDWGLNSTLLINRGSIYASSGLQYYGEHIQLTPGILLSNRSTYGMMLNVNANWQAVNAYLYSMKIFSHQSDSDYNPDQEYSYYYDNFPLATNNLQINGGLGINIGNANVSLGLGLSKRNDESTFKNYSLNFDKPLYSKGDTSVQLQLSLTRSGDDTAFNAGLTWMFYPVNTFAQVSLGYTGDNITQTNEKSMMSDVQLRKTYNLQDNKQFTVSGQYHKDSTSNYLSSDLNYLSDYLQAKLNIQHSFPMEGYANDSSTTYNGEIDSNIGYAQGHYSFGYNSGWLTGVMVYAAAPVTEKIKIYVDGDLKATGYTNRPKTVYLEPYQSYNISIVPTGMNIFQYDSNPKHIVLYKGNIKYLQWDLAKEFILFAQIINKSGKPLHDALLETKTGDFNATDDNGMIQANITTKTDHLEFLTGVKQSCVAKIPHNLKIRDNFVELKKALVCE